MMRLALFVSLLASPFVFDGCLIGGCVQPNGDSCGYTEPPPSATPDMAGPTCATGCGPCATGEICITPEHITQDRAFCAHTCADDRNCAAGERCLALFASSAPSACVPSTLAIGCGDWSTEICDAQPSCDGDVALEPFSDAARGLCGWDRTFCANGCTAGACN
ncbi:MAG TPA: hypothetical protein VGL86_18270 [Polyangia bacterium]|jgi:hypothetical protein